MKTLKNFPNLYQFQKDSITKLITVLQRDNGCFENSQTGLGKTIIGATTAINITDQKILIISPKNMQKDWQKAMEGENVEICTKMKIPNGIYGCIIVDEAHQFQSHKNKSYMELFKLINQNRCPVILMSATPFQNNLEELLPMYGLIHFKQDSLAFNALGIVLKNINDLNKKISNMERFDGGYSGSFQTIGKMVTAESQLYMKEILLFGQIANSFSNRLTWESVLSDYAEDMKRLGGFPSKVEETYEYNPFGEYSLFSETRNSILDMTFALYNRDKYFGKENENLGIEGLMKSLIFKRLDSSANAFKNTLSNMKERFLGEISLMERENTNEFIALYISDLKKDVSLLDILISNWNNHDDSVKLSQLETILKKVVGKVIIFTEYIDTLEVLTKHFKDNKRVISFSGKSSSKDLEKVINDFDPSAEKQTNNYDILIATDTLSEGVSLHNANNIIHFDLKWNPSRITQRNGRINRIGNKKKEVYIHTLSVPSLIESIILLENKIKDKGEISEIIMNALRNEMVLNYSNMETGKYYQKETTSDIKDLAKSLLVRTSLGDIEIKKKLWIGSTERSLFIFPLNNISFESKDCPISIGDVFHYRFESLFALSIEMNSITEKYIYVQQGRSTNIRIMNCLYNTQVNHIIREMCKETGKTDDEGRIKLRDNMQSFYDTLSEPLLEIYSTTSTN